jgi:hypothetical protein
MPLRLKSRNSSIIFLNSSPLLNWIDGPRYILMAIWSLFSPILFIVVFDALLLIYCVMTNMSWLCSIAVLISSITILLRNILFLSKMILKHHTENSGGIFEDCNISLSSMKFYSLSRSILLIMISHLLSKVRRLMTFILLAISFALYLYSSILCPSLIWSGILIVGCGLFRLARFWGVLLLNKSIILSNGSIVVDWPLTLWIASNKS